MKKILLNDNWKFSYSTGTGYLDTHGAAYKKMVTLPHDFMIATERTADARTESAGGYFQGGIGTYEKELMIPADAATVCGKHYFLLFEGSYGNTEVWVNGNLAALHHYGYTEFLVDITPFIKIGSSNKLKVIVENNALPNSRWYTGSGIYRNVWLLEAGDVYLDPWAVAVTTPTLDRILIQITIQNASAATSEWASISICDTQGRQILADQRKIELAAGCTEASFEFHSESLIPWSIDSPYLYTLQVTVGNDTQETVFGVRTLRFCREGFFLNEKPIKLQGGCIHHDNGIAGACAFDILEERKIRILKEAGFNAIRTAHNPMSTALLNACDKYGMLVIDECFDCWNAKKNPFDFHLYFEKHWQEELASMIKRDRNHPSVILYSIGNEIGERDGSSFGAEYSAQMCRFVRDIDHTRAITNGICAIFLDAGEFGGIIANIFGSGDDVDFDSLPSEIKDLLKQAEDVTEQWGEITERFASDLDVVGYNYLDDRYEQDGIRFPERIIVGTESYPGKMKQVWERTTAHPYVIGDFTWTAFDYLGESGIGHAFYDQSGGLFCDYPFHMGNCGDFDINGCIRPQGRFRQLLWGNTSGPVITVLKPQHHGKKESISTWGWPDTSESWTWPGYEGKPVRLDIFSKAPEVEITINGQTVCRELVPDSWILQTDVIYEPGVLTVTEYDGSQILGKATLTTVGNIDHINITEEFTEDSSEDGIGKIRLYQVSAVDQNGHRVPWCQKKVRICLQGAELIAFGSADPVNKDNYTSDTCTLFEGRSLLIVRQTKVPVKIDAEFMS